MDLPRPTDGALAQPMRARVFALLVERRAPLDTREIAAHFDLHPNGVRVHLERLEEGGFVVRGRQRGGPGRPRDVWTVSPQSHPDGIPPRAFAELAAWLARSIPDSEPRLREVEQTGREVGAELAPERPVDPVAGFRDAIAALGFEPELEETSRGYRCQLRNCPYGAAAVANQTVVCRLHRGITAGLLAAVDPEAELVEFEPREPVDAGCMVEVARRGGGGERS
jgi:predicted ArsR family transcriptional regulator